MQITEIRVHHHEIVVAAGEYQMSTSTVRSLASTVVEIRTDEGVTGFGETTPLGPTYQDEQHAGGARAAIDVLAPALLGVDPRRSGHLHAAMDAALGGHRYAKAALDVAAWDCTAKAYGERVCDLLGGAVREQVPSYFGVMPDAPSATAATAAAKEAAGYRRIQVKAGGRPLATDIETVHAVADALSPMTRLLVDPNRGWTMRDTLEFSGACRSLRLAIEQPCRTYDEHRRIADKLHHPLFLDESTVDVSTVTAAIADGVAQGFGMKLSRIGGLTPLRLVRDLCAEHGVPLTIDDTWGGDLAAAATVHLGATVPDPVMEGTWISQPYQEPAYPCRTPTIAPIGGSIPLPTGPGLGVEPDLDAWGEPASVHR